MKREEECKCAELWASRQHIAAAGRPLTKSKCDACKARDRKADDGTSH